MNAHLKRALDLARSGQVAAAASHLDASFRDTAPDPLALCLLGTFRQQLHQPDLALGHYDAAAAIDPTSSRPVSLACALLLQLDRPVDAERRARRLLDHAPHDGAANFQLGLALEHQRQWSAAAAAYRGALDSAHPSDDATYRLAVCLCRSGDLDAAATLAQDIASNDPLRAESVADEMQRAGATDAAVRLLGHIAERHPGRYETPLAAARLLFRGGSTSTAISWAERAQRLRPDAVEPLEMRATAMIDRGEVEPGLEIYRDLETRGRLDAAAGQRYLVLAHYDPTPDIDRLFDEHRRWASRYVRAFGTPFRRAATRADSRWRIGWISPRFDEGPVARFLLGLLARLDRERFRIVLVSLAPGADQSALRGRADEWHDMHGAGDVELLDALRALRLDVAIDLAGHAAFNRATVLAQRVAPVQACWLDYFNTTAIPAIDAWVSDAWLSPADGPQRYTERVERLAHGRFCYAPPDDAPSDPDFAGDDDVIVFAAFQRLAKVNDAVLDTWAEILRRVPAAILQLGTRLLDDDDARAHLLDRFARRGIAADRVELHGRRVYSDLMEAYRRVDIALDPFPFSGCTTSCDALWMGVPVVTLPGDSYVSRQSASLSWRIGDGRGIAADREDYIERAIALAHDVATLRAGRASLRERVREHLCDRERHAAEFGSLLERWCTSGVVGDAR